MNDPHANVLRQRARTTDLWLDVSGPSMGPALVPPAQVLVRVPDRPRPGQVWAFVERDGSIVVHRCLRRYRSGWYGFRGDAVAADDLPVGPQRLIGRAVAVRDRSGERSVASSYLPVLRAQVRRIRRRRGRAEDT